MTIIDTLVDTHRYARVTMCEIETVAFANRTLLVSQVWFDPGAPSALFRCDASARNPYFITRERGKERATLIVPKYGPKLISFEIDPTVIAELKEQRYRHFIDDSDWR